MRLVAGDRHLDGVEGSSTWRGIARDVLLDLPGTWLPVRGGETLTFAADGPTPNEAFLTVYAEGSVADRSMSAIAGMELDPQQPTWRVDLPPGRFVITLARTWGGGQDVAHAFGIDVNGIQAS